MEDTEKTAPARGLVVEFDFTAAPGAELLFAAAKEILKPLGVALTDRLEAKYLAGANMQTALAELFEAEGSGADAAQAAKDIADAFRKAIDGAMEKAFTPGFTAFLKAVAAKGVKIVLATHGNAERLQEIVAKKTALDSIVVYAEPSATYGSCRWDAWKRATHTCGLGDAYSAALSGSGLGVKSALVANLAAAAVVNPRTEYQDFGGADVVVDKIDASLAGEIAAMLHL